MNWNSFWITVAVGLVVLYGAWLIDRLIQKRRQKRREEMARHADSMARVRRLAERGAEIYARPHYAPPPSRPVHDRGRADDPPVTFEPYSHVSAAQTGETFGGGGGESGGGGASSSWGDSGSSSSGSE